MLIGGGGRYEELVNKRGVQVTGVLIRRRKLKKKPVIIHHGEDHKLEEQLSIVVVLPHHHHHQHEFPTQAYNLYQWNIYFIHSKLS